MIDKGAAADAAAAAYCNDASHKNSSETKVAGSGQYGIGKGEASYDQTHNDDTASKNCGSSSNSQNTDRFHYEAQRALKPELITAWLACKMRETGLVCIPSPGNDAAHPSVMINWLSPNRRQVLVKRSSIDNGTLLDGKSTIYPAGSELDPGQDIVPLVRSKGSGPLKVNITVVQDHVRSACEVSFPAPPVKKASVVRASPPATDPLSQATKLKFKPTPQCQAMRDWVFQTAVSATAIPTANDLRSQANAQGAQIQFSQALGAAKAGSCLEEILK